MRVTALEREVVLGRHRDELRDEGERLERLYQGEIKDHHDTVSANWRLREILGKAEKAFEAHDYSFHRVQSEEVHALVDEVLREIDEVVKAQFNEPELRDKVQVASDRVLDACEQCGGARGGKPGNEKMVSGVTLCDYCEAMRGKTP